MTQSKDKQITLYYRFLHIISMVASVFLFLLIAGQLWYVLGHVSGTALLIAGLAFFLGVLQYQHRVTGVWCWLAWSGWLVLAGLAGTFYSMEFMNRAAFTRVPDVLVAMNPYIAGFILPIILTAILIASRVLWPPRTRKKQSTSFSEEKIS